MQWKQMNIALLAVGIFILFVGYKYISSNIQENKEKAVIQERAAVEQQERQQQSRNLSDCLNLADLDEKSKIDWYLDDFYAKYGRGTWSTPIQAAFVQLTEEAQAETKQKKAACYKRYPQE